MIAPKPIKLSGAEPNQPIEHGMRLHDRARADFHLVADAGVGADLDILGQPRRGLDDRRRMNLHRIACLLEAEIRQPAFRGRRR